jgi:pilus assembly protein CpaE
MRKALIVAGAAGPGDVAGILNRFGFGPPVDAPNINAAIARMSDDHYDLVILPLQDLDAVQLAALEREIRRGRFTSVVGTAPRADPELILRAMRAGIQEFVVYPPEPQDLTAAVDRLMRRHQVEVRRGHVAAVFSSKGGLGNTSLAVNLAYGFAHNHPDARVAVADLVVAGGDVRVFLNLRPSYDLGDLVAKVDRIDADLMYSLLTPCPGGVWALAASDKPDVDDVADAAAITMIVQQLQAHFAYTVLDCEHYMNERTLAAMDAADSILLVTQLTVPALRSTQRTLAICRRLGYPESKLCVIVNRYPSGEILTLSDAVDVLKCEIFWKLPNDYRASALALNKGVPVYDIDPRSKLAWSYQQLAAKLGGGHRPSGETTTNGRGHSRLRQLFGMKKES